VEVFNRTTFKKTGKLQNSTLDHPELLSLKNAD
jgi:hypothetical protein